MGASRRCDEFPPDTLYHQLIGSLQVDGPVLRVERRKPIVVSPPLRGSGWIATNACCEPSSHRSFVLAANGGFVTPEVFAIDFIREEGAASARATALRTVSGRRGSVSSKGIVDMCARGPRSSR